ncbi:MAG TPA: hypothetical protein VF024_00900 [Solirubrobacteraceae bacterium]
MSVLVTGAPGVVQLTICPSQGADYSQYVATSGDGGVSTWMDIVGAPVQAPAGV